jgi:hypothetical protein
MAYQHELTCLGESVHDVSLQDVQDLPHGLDLRQGQDQEPIRRNGAKDSVRLAPFVHRERVLVVVVDGCIGPERRVVFIFLVNLADADQVLGLLDAINTSPGASTFYGREDTSSVTGSSAIKAQDSLNFLSSSVSSCFPNASSRSRFDVQLTVLSWISESISSWLAKAKANSSS